MIVVVVLKFISLLISVFHLFWRDHYLDWKHFWSLFCNVIDLSFDLYSSTVYKISLYLFVLLCFSLSPNRLPLWSGFWTMKKGFGRGVCFGRWRSGTEKGNGRNRTKIRISVLSFSVQGKILFLYREALKRCFNGVKYCACFFLFFFFFFLFLMISALYEGERICL